MIDNTGMYQGYSVEGTAELKVTPETKGTTCNTKGMVCPPVYECPVEKCIHREIVHEVPQDCLRYVILYGISFVNVSKTYISAEYRSFFLV